MEDTASKSKDNVPSSIVTVSVDRSGAFNDSNVVPPSQDLIFTRKFIPQRTFTIRVHKLILLTEGEAM